jgi:diacylglycerol kinase family enzyme
MRTHRLLLVNPRAGGGKRDVAALEAAARSRGIGVHVLQPGDDPQAIARAAAPEALGIAGGDGSLAVVAASAIELGVPFVCIPFGTRNHFAHDAGLDLDLIEALAAFDGAERRIDAGRVAGRLFLNNVSIGAYAWLVHRRSLRTLISTVRARVDGDELVARVLLVGNNRYELDLSTLGARARLDEGVLQLRTATGVLPRTWSERVAPRFRIELARDVRAAIDGEPVRLSSPLELESLPGALRLLCGPRG